MTAVRQGLPEPLRERLREGLALVLIGFSLYALLSLATFALPPVGESAPPRGNLQNLGGLVGYYLAHAFTFVFGVAAYVPFLFLLLYAVRAFLRRPLSGLSMKALGVVVLTAMLSLLLAGPDGMAGYSSATPYGAGGRLGANLSPKLHYAFGGSGRILLLVFGAIVAAMLATDWLFSRMLDRASEACAAWLERRRSARAAVAGACESPEERASADLGEGARRVAREDPEAEDPEEENEFARVVDEENDEDGEEDAQDGDLADREAAGEPAAAAPPPPSRRRRDRTPRRPRQMLLPRPSERGVAEGEYPFPPIDLFCESRTRDDATAKGVIERNARAIEQRLGSFKIGAEVVGVSQGPAVTQYEVRLAEGIKVSRVVSYEADLAAALRAVSVRVVAPIPGRDTVGVEVPNQERQIVVMRELLEQFGRAEDLAIPLFLGKDVAGAPIVEDLARMPHLLIAGATGSGKSVCINSILLSILMTRTPEQVRLILIDPKMVELQAYRRVPHLSCEVVTHMKKAPEVLQWAVEEMERRYGMLSAVGVNHIASYNRLGREELSRRLEREVEPGAERMPHQVVVIDELADLMTVAQKEVEESIQRLAQKSRAVGIHVILATQRPSTDVITGVIKANLPCQIAFKVARKVDSRVILDCNGAEKLLGHGDMLYVASGAHRIVRAQGTFVAEEEIRRVVGYLEQHGPEPAFLPDLVQSRRGRKRRPQDRDELYEQAVEIVLGQQRGSATLLQRALAVGYTRATRLLEMMEDDGLVGPHRGSRSRDVLLTLEEWRAREQEAAEALEEPDESLAEVEPE